VAYFGPVSAWLFSQEDAGRGSPAPTAATTTGAGRGAQPDAAADRGGHRALRNNQAGKLQHGVVPLRARHDPDRLQDRTHRYRLQEDAGNQVTLGLHPDSSDPFRLSGTPVTDCIQR
jgi:hypothetical protein